MIISQVVLVTSSACAVLPVAILSTCTCYVDNLVYKLRVLFFRHKTLLHPRSVSCSSDVNKAARIRPKQCHLYRLSGQTIDFWDKLYNPMMWHKANHSFNTLQTGSGFCILDFAVLLSCRWLGRGDSRRNCLPECWCYWSEKSDLD